MYKNELEEMHNKNTLPHGSVFLYNTIYTLE